MSDLRDGYLNSSLFFWPYGEALEKLTISIATRNSESTIGRCLDCVIKVIPQKLIADIIVVDNDSADSTIAILKTYRMKFPLIRIVRQSGLLGAVRARQAEESKSEWIAIVDSDVYLYPQWWEEVSKFLYRRDVGLVAGILEGWYSEPYRSFFEWQSKRIGGAALSNTLIKRHLVMAVSKGLARVHGSEDLFIYESVRRAGLKTVGIKKILGFHEGDRDDLLQIKSIRAGQSFGLLKGPRKATIKAVMMPFTNSLKNLMYFLEGNCSFLSFLRLERILLAMALYFAKGVFGGELVREIH